jgi:flagellar motor switch protein FliG
MEALERIGSSSHREIQDWLRKVDMTTLAVALLGASTAVRNKVLQNLSRNAGDYLEKTIKRYESLQSRELLIQSSADRLQSLM